MAYTVPTTAAGQILTDAIWNASVRDDGLYFKDRIDNPPRCSLTHSTTQSIATGTDTPVAFNTETYDLTGLHDTVTNNSRITAPTGEGGVWHFTGSVEFATSATGQRKLLLRANGTTIFSGDLVDAAAGSQSTRLSVAADIALSAAGYVELVVSQNSGGSINLTTDVFFTGRRAA